MALTTNLVAYWKLDESSGNAADSHSSNTLTNNNTVTYTSAKLNNGAAFGSPNTNKSLSRTDALGFTTDNTIVVSVSAWVKYSSFPVSDIGVAFSITSTNATRMLFGFRGDGSGNCADVEMYCVGTTGGTMLSFSNVYSANTWYHVVWILDTTNSTSKIYVNGSAVVTGTATYRTNTTNTAKSGIVENAGYPISGFADEVGVWSRALTATEVSQLYNGGNPLPYPLTVFMPQSNPIAKFSAKNRASTY